MFMLMIMIIIIMTTTIITTIITIYIMCIIIARNGRDDHAKEDIVSCSVISYQTLSHRSIYY